MKLFLKNSMKMVMRVMGDEGKRKQYDQQKNNPFPGFNGGGGGPSMDDIFAQFFGGQMPNQKRQRQTPEKLIKKTVKKKRMLQEYSKR